MKLLYITTRIDGVGGLQRTTSVKLNYLAEKGYDITILTTNSKNKIIHYPILSKIKHIDIQNVSSFFNYRKIIQNIHKKINPDITIVVDNGLKGFLIPCFLPKKANLIYEVHATKETIISQTGNRFLRKLGISEALISNSIKKFDTVVFLTQTESQKWNARKKEVIQNPLWFSTEKTSSLTNKKVVFSGRLNLIKGVDFLLEIWKIVSEKYSDWTLEIYGEESDKFDVEKQIKSLNLFDSVKVFNHSDIIQEKYLESSVLLMTSRYESFGLSLIEAMSCGVPCISFDSEGPSSIIKNGENGFLIPCFNLELFSEKVIELIEKELLRKQMGKNAKESVQKFALEAIMNRWEELFNNFT